MSIFHRKVIIKSERVNAKRKGVEAGSLDVFNFSLRSYREKKFTTRFTEQFVRKWRNLMAQLVEQLTLNQRVPGSSSGGRTRCFLLAC